MTQVLISRETRPAHASLVRRDDGDLLTSIRNGDENAMALLYDRYAKTVYSMALLVLHHPTSAEELLEEIFLDIWRMPEDYLAVRGSLAAWLPLIARNRAIAMLRREPPQEIVAALSLASPYDLSKEEERTDLACKVHAGLLALPGDRKRVFNMAFFDGLPFKEIGEMTGDSGAIVKQKILDVLFSIREASLR